MAALVAARVGAKARLRGDEVRGDSCDHPRAHEAARGGDEGVILISMGSPQALENLRREIVRKILATFAFLIIESGTLSAQYADPPPRGQGYVFMGVGTRGFAFGVSRLCRSTRFLRNHRSLLGVPCRFGAT